MQHKNLLDKKLALLRLAAIAGDPPACAAWAKALSIGEVGERTQRSDRSARYFTSVAAHHGVETAFAPMARFFHFGIGGRKDLIASVLWYEKAARAGDSDSMYQLGEFSAPGLDGESPLAPSKQRAFYWLHRAETQNNPDALNLLGWLYRQGDGVKYDPTRASSYYQRAADLGSAAAMHNLGVLYEYGEGVPYDGTKAIEWYMKAYRASSKRYSFIPDRIASDRKSIMTPPGVVLRADDEMTARFPTFKNVTSFKGNSKAGVTPVG